MWQWLHLAVASFGIGSMWQWLHVAVAACGSGFIWQWLHLALAPCGSGCMWQWLHVAVASFGSGCMWQWIHVAVAACRIQMACFGASSALVRSEEMLIEFYTEGFSGRPSRKANFYGLSYRNRRSV